MKKGIVDGMMLGKELVMIFVEMEMKRVGSVKMMMNVMNLWVEIGRNLMIGERMYVSEFIGMCIEFFGVFMVF